MSNRFELENQYLAAKEAYYAGEPLMTDDEFDYLESQLLSLGSDVPYIVGANDRKAKYSHPSPMLSLGKYQASVNGNPPTSSATAWMKKFGATSFEITPKYDGNAANAIYINGRLNQILSRGTGSKGRDITDKVKHNLPETINLEGTVEIRGEVVIKVSIFNEKYSAYKNPRNFVAGILNRDDNNPEVISYLDFIPLEIRQHTDERGTEYSEIYEVEGFRHRPHVHYCEPGEFESAYQEMVKYRQTAEYQLDGFVIKAPTGLRPIWGENSHSPNWAVAIKFPPKETITTVEQIVWHYGKTGELNPVAIMKPVDLDGSTVSRASVFNYGYVKSLGVYPGAVVAIAKSGDIIPQIQRVIQPGDSSQFEYPTTCKCGAELKITGIHLYCDSPNCTVVEKNRFAQSVAVLDLDGIGGAMIQTLWNAGYRSGLDFLQPAKFSKEKLIATGFFKEGKTLDNLLTQVGRIKELKPSQVLMMLGFPNMGWTTAAQVGKYLHGEKYSFHGLQKDVVAGFGPGEPKRLAYETAVNAISSYVKIVQPEKVSIDSVGFEMTGSPKAFGFKTKDEFIQQMKTKGYHHTDLNDAQVLFTDDLSSTSSKMKSAIAKGMSVKLYSEA